MALSPIRWRVEAYRGKEEILVHHAAFVFSNSEISSQEFVSIRVDLEKLLGRSILGWHCVVYSNIFRLMEDSRGAA
jgi:hypothetical protein